jgi:hypothetical protein
MSLDQFPAACCVVVIGSTAGLSHSRIFLAGIQANFGLDPDPFDLAQGRGEHSRTTIKAFGGDALGTIAFS